MIRRAYNAGFACALSFVRKIGEASSHLYGFNDAERSAIIKAVDMIDEKFADDPYSALKKRRILR